LIDQRDSSVFMQGHGTTKHEPASLLSVSGTTIYLYLVLFSVSRDADAAGWGSETVILKGLKNLYRYEWLVFGSLRIRDRISISIRNLELLAGLAEDRVVSLRREVTQNKSTPEVALSRLNEDANLAVFRFAQASFGIRCNPTDRTN
jgi:hypothetical protein